MSSLGGLLAVVLMACGDGSGSGPGERDDGATDSAHNEDAGQLGQGAAAARATSLDGVWVATREPAQLVRFAPGGSRPAETIALEHAPLFVEIVDGVAFYINQSICLDDRDFCSTVHFHELLTGKTGEIQLAPQTATGSMAYADGSLWVADEATDALWRIDPSSKELVGGIKLDLHSGDGGNGLDVAANDHSVFVASLFGDAAAARVNMATHKLEAAGGEGDGTTGIAATNDAVWVTSRFDGTLRRLDVHTLAVAASIELDADISAQVRNVAIVGPDVWVVAGQGGNAQDIFGEAAKPGLFRVAASTGSLVSHLALEQPGGLRARNGQLWAMTEAAGLEIDLSANKVARTLTPASGSVTDIVIPVTGGGTGTTEGRGKIDPFSVVEPPPDICEQIHNVPHFGMKPVLGAGSASLTRAGTTTLLTAGTCQILRDSSGKALQYLATFANAVPGESDTLTVAIDGYVGDGTYRQVSGRWSSANGSSVPTGPVVISQAGLHGSTTVEGGSVTFDCGVGAAVSAASSAPQPIGAGEALVTDTNTGEVYRFVNVACERDFVSQKLVARTPTTLAAKDFYSFALESWDAAAAGMLEGNLSFWFYDRGHRGLQKASLTLVCGATATGSFASADGRYKGTFDCGK